MSTTLSTASQQVLSTYRQYAEVQSERVREPKPVQTADSDFTSTPSQISTQIARRIEELLPRLREFAIDLYHHPELAFQEHRSVAKIAEFLAEEGVEANIGAFGLDTALHASVGTDGGPHFAFLAEYDALPDIGHACGHNIIASVSLAAFLSVRDVLPEGARLSLIGTPAEEGGAGKELIIRAGGFDDVDAAGQIHPGPGNLVSPIHGGSTSGLQRLRVRYHGRASHAAASPHLGFNALDAVITAYQSIAQLRQHILPIDRIHGVIINGGLAANIVPEVTEAEFIVRSSDISTLKVLVARVRAILQAAADATGTTVEISDDEPPYLPLRNNVELIKRWAAGLRERGRQVPIAPAAPSQGGPSTDAGNVSQFIPTIHPGVGLGGPLEASPHNAAFADTTITESAFAALADAAYGLAHAGFDFLNDPQLRAGVVREFTEAGGRLRWEDFGE